MAENRDKVKDFRDKKLKHDMALLQYLRDQQNKSDLKRVTKEESQKSEFITLNQKMINFRKVEKDTTSEIKKMDTYDFFPFK
jgi:hypothetical protein